jgi:hypothetical protein
MLFEYRNAGLRKGGNVVLGSIFHYIPRRQAIHKLAALKQGKQAGCRK